MSKNTRFSITQYFLAQFLGQFILTLVILSGLITTFVISPLENQRLLIMDKELIGVLSTFEHVINHESYTLSQVVLLNEQEAFHESIIFEMVGSPKEFFYMTSLIILDEKLIVDFAYPDEKLIGYDLSNKYKNYLKSEGDYTFIAGDNKQLVECLTYAGGKTYVAEFEMDFDKMIQSSNIENARSKFFILDQYDNVLLSNNNKVMYHEPEVLSEQNVDVGGEILNYRTIEVLGEKYVREVRRLDELEWEFYMTIPLSEFRANTHLYYSILLVISLIMAILMTLFYNSIRRQLLKPVIGLIEAFSLHKIQEMKKVKITGSRIEEIDILDKEFERLVEQLSLKEQELNEFIYVASHDLQEPLRVITSYINIIQMEYEETFDDDGRKYLKYVVDGSMRMRNLILDLLEYSRVSNNEVTFDEIDLNEIMAMVINNLEIQINESGGDIHCEKLPTVVGNEYGLLQVFQNLVSNGLKFCQDKPVIKIYCDENHIYLEDNGIGIKEEYFDTIFKPFKRLNAKGSYKGTGIGLSVVKKVIEQHGWQLNLTSEVNKGTRFIITIRRT